MFSNFRSASTILKNTSTASFLQRNTTNHVNLTYYRSFHASAANMTIKCFFDCTWTGPEIKVDASGKETSKDNEVKGMSSHQYELE